MKDLILHDGTVIAIKDNTSTSFTVEGSNIKEIFEMLTDENLKKITVTETLVGTVNGEEQTITEEIGIFTNLHAVSATYDGHKSTFNLTQISDNELRMSALESAVDDLVLAQLM